jgi:hypothetical protein
LKSPSSAGAAAKLSLSSAHRLAAPLAASAISIATTETRDRSTAGAKSEAASCTQRPSGACQYVPRRPARTSWKSLPQYGRLMSCVIRFIFAAFRVARVSSRMFHGAGNEKGPAALIGHRAIAGKAIALHPLAQDEGPAMPWHRDHVVHAARPPFVIVEYQYRACKAHARNSLPGNCWKGRSGE